MWWCIWSLLKSIYLKWITNEIIPLIWWDQDSYLASIPITKTIGRRTKKFKPDDTIPTVKLAWGNIMVWDCFSYSAVWCFRYATLLNLPANTKANKRISHLKWPRQSIEMYSIKNVCQWSRSAMKDSPKYHLKNV